MVYRIDIHPRIADPLGKSTRTQIHPFIATIAPITTSRIFLIETDAPRAKLEPAAHALLPDPIVERAELADKPRTDPATSRIEIHLKPGVMDPVAASTEMA